MALVGAPVSVFLQQQQTQMERQDNGRTASVRSLGSARIVLTEIEEEPAVAEEVEEEKEKVYFAVVKEVKEGKANLLWLLANTSGKKNIVIVHVHRRAQRIPMRMPAMGIIGKVRESLKKGCLDEILDASAGGWPYERTKHLARLGLKCCEANRKKRPCLAGEVWRVLEPMM